MRWVLPVLFLLLFNQLAAQPGTETVDPVIRLSDSAECTIVKNQNLSPTCWVFGTNSLFESDLLKKYSTRLDLSEMFIARYAYIDKANKYLATSGKTYFEGGGQFHDVIRVVKKYGMVPESAYSGRVDSRYGHEHAGLDTAMKYLIKEYLAAGKKELNDTDLQQINDTLDRYLGKVPAYFLYRNKEYTPVTFAKEVVRFNDDYVELMSFADLPLYKKCLLVDKYNWAGDSIYNVPLEDMQQLVDTALSRGWSVGWEGDVTEPGFNFWNGFAAAADSAYNYDSIRIQSYKNENTERDHMLHLVGIGRDENNKKWYYLKNSWGTWMSKYKGYLYMEENYFKVKTVILLVNKKGVPQQLKVKLGLKD